ncbi:MAG: DUF120 domain-containing protein [Patescibacteria group bacterium]
MSGIPGLMQAYEKKLGIKLYPGTLNVKIEKPFSFPKKRMRLEKEEYKGKVSINILPCKINGVKAFILRTDKNEEEKGIYPKTVLEIASGFRLRDKLNIKDGDEVIIEI